MKYLLIAEKPSLMRDIQKTYNKHKSDINKKVGEVDFTALVGHVCRLVTPDGYEAWNTKWADIELPIIPEVFKIEPIPSAKKVISDLSRKLKENSYDGIIVATDADTEGNGIYYLLCSHLKLEKYKTLRFFINDQTDAELYKSFLNMTDFYSYPRDVRMTEAFLIRSHMDWLIGMNFTIGASVRSGQTLKIGRVKTPTLKLVYDNCKEINEFVSHTDYGIDAEYKEGFSGSLIDDDSKVKHFKEKKEAEDFSSKLSSKAKVVSVTKKNESTPPPQLYNLSDIQTEAGGKYGYSPAKTLELIQSLYENHKLLSYPRTDGRYVSSEKAKEFSSLVDIMDSIPELKSFTSKITPADIKRAQSSKRTVNDEEVAKASHDALLPTKCYPGMEALSDDEKNIYLMVCKRFICQFFPAEVNELTTVLSDIDGNIFRSSGKVNKEKGWTEVYETKKSDTVLPALKKGDILNVGRYLIPEYTTHPPKRYTQATLINAMVNINKLIEDKGYKKIMKEVKGLGTQASRASIITALIKDGYMEEKKSGKSKGLYITPKGKFYIEAMKDNDVVKPELTAVWETKMQEIKEGTESFDNVNKEMLEYIKKTVKSIEKTVVKAPGSGFQKKSSTGLICPLCKSPVIKGKYGWFCSSKRETDCPLSISSTIAGKTVTDSMAKTLLEKGKTKELSGFKSKAGNPFSAVLMLKNGKVEFSFNNTKKRA